MIKQNVIEIITVGASAGGIESVSDFLKVMPADLNAAIFVVIHIPRDSLTEVVLRQLQRSTQLDCRVPVDGDEIQKGMVYLAPADHHMMLQKGEILIKKGPKENHWRPSINVLFRSAAATYDSCVIGVILTGLLDDGTSGMTAIKKSGGICMVQDPEEATFADMPNNVLNNVDVDYKVPIADMGYIVSDIHVRRTCSVAGVPDDVKLEAAITFRMNSDYNEMKVLGEPTPFTCPDCGGILTRINEQEGMRYRCFTGHSFTEHVLVKSQLEALENSIWVSIRMLEERRNLLITMANNGDSNKSSASRQDRLERGEEISVHIERLKKFLLSVGEL